MRQSIRLWLCAGIAASAAIILPGCRGSRQASTSSGTSVPTVSGAVSRGGDTASSVAAAISASQKEWTSVELPVKIRLTSPVSASVDARATLWRGRYARFSVRVLGFEVASAWIDTDSVHAVDKVGKRYVSESIARVTTDLGLDIAGIQDILLGRLFAIGDTPVSFTATDAGIPDKTLLVPAPSPAGIEYGFVCALTDPAVDYLLVDAGTIQATAAYSGRASTPAGPIPAEVAISAQTDTRAVSARLTWSLSSAKWDTGSPQTWQAPGKGYKRISLSDLMGIISKL